jgi:hypothetical protein
MFDHTVGRPVQALRLEQHFCLHVELKHNCCGVLASPAAETAVAAAQINRLTAAQVRYLCPARWPSGGIGQTIYRTAQLL